MRFGIDRLIGPPFRPYKEKPKTILVVEDDPDIKAVLNDVLDFEGYQVRQAGNTAEARLELEKNPIDLMFLDFRLPDKDGLTFLRESLRRTSSLRVIMMSGLEDNSLIAECISAGAMNFLYKGSSDFDIDYILSLVQETLNTPPPSRRILSIQDSLRRDEEVLRSLGRDPNQVVQMIGRSRIMRAAVEQIGFAARTGSAPVLITGETGTGKEVAGNLLHSQSPRAEGPLVKVNIASLQSNLVASELFGHVKGAYTGATSDRLGLFLAADGGTIILDEIGDMSRDVQVLLLRALREKVIRRVGEDQETPIDVWVIASTNKDLKEEVRRGRFRKDLYYRLGTIPIHLPPLRDRREDIPRLTAFFLRRDYQSTPISDEALDSLMEPRRRWRGNVAELRDVLERAVSYSQGEIITVKHLNEMPRDFDNPMLPWIQKARSLDRRAHFLGRDLVRLGKKVFTE